MDNNYSYDVNDGALGALLAVYILIMIAIYVVTVIGLWKMYVKAGRPGWAAIIPIYNWWVWVEMIGRPRWWFWALVASVLLSWIPHRRHHPLHPHVRPVSHGMPRHGQGVRQRRRLPASACGSCRSCSPRSWASATRSTSAPWPRLRPAGTAPLRRLRRRPLAATRCRRLLRPRRRPPVTPVQAAAPAAPVTPPATPAQAAPAAPVTPPATAAVPETPPADAGPDAAPDATSAAPDVAPETPDVPPAPPASSPPPPPPLT